MNDHDDEAPIAVRVDEANDNDADDDENTPSPEPTPRALSQDRGVLGLRERGSV